MCSLLYSEVWPVHQLRSQNEVPQAGGLNRQAQIVSQFWRLQTKMQVAAG